MNAPHSTEHFTLAEDEEKITYQIDLKLADSGTFYILKEDHTLGNPLRMALLRDPRVLFAGYRNPHPLVPLIHVKVRTRPLTDPLTVMKDALEGLEGELSSLEEQLRIEVQRMAEREKADREGNMMDFA